MAVEATYDGPASSTRDLVRFLAGDTGRDGEFFLSDDEVDYLVTTRTTPSDEPRPYLTAADAARRIAARVAQRSDTVVNGDVQRSDRTDSLAAKYKALEKELRAESVTRDPGGGGEVVVLTGGADTLPFDGSDDDAIGRYFRVGQFSDRRNF